MKVKIYNRKSHLEKVGVSFQDKTLIILKIFDCLWDASSTNKG